MKIQNRGHYSDLEMQILSTAAVTKWSTAKLSRRYGKQFNRSASGVYAKIKEIRDFKVLEAKQPVIEPMVVQTNLPLVTPAKRLDIKSVEVFDTYIKLNF